MRWQLATALVLAAGTLNGCACEPPTPVLYVSPGTSVETGQLVTFDSNTMGDEPPDHVNSDATLAWDLDGDGRFDTAGGRVQQKRFDVPGTYRVTFDVRTQFTDSFLEGPLDYHGYASATVVVTAPPGGPPGGPPANQAPTASFTTSPDPGYTERDITFDGSPSSDSDGQIVKYEWDWTADGTYDESGASASATHHYDFAGTYTVRLRVTDEKGATGVTERTVQVQDGVPPGKVIARAQAGVSAAGAGTPLTLRLGQVSLNAGTTTVSGAKLVTAGIRAH